MNRPGAIRSRPSRRWSPLRSARLQWALLVSLAVIWWFWPPPASTPAVRPGSRTNWDGFLALSYPGLRERGGAAAISAGRLREHLTALTAAGYQPITLEEAREFLQCRAPLPPKAVLLTFDDGRRETVREAERVLRDLRWPAVLFLRPEAMEKSDLSYPTWRDLRALLGTGRWSFGSRGLRARESVEMEGGKGRGLFLVSRAYLTERGRIETEEEWRGRVQADLRESLEIIRRRLPGAWPGVFAFPWSDDGRTMPDGGETLRRIVADSFPMAFAEAGYAFNDARRPPLQLTRLLVSPEWRGRDVVERLEAQGARRSPFIAGSERDWGRKVGRLQVDRGQVTLEPQDRLGAEAWLLGSEPWRCLRGEATMETRPEAQAWIYLGAVPGRRYVRLGWSGRRIEVQSQVDGGVTLLAHGSVPEGAAQVKVTFDVFDRRIRFAVEGGQSPARSFPLPPEIDGGLAGLGVWLLKGGGAPVAFEGLRLEPRLPRGAVVQSLEHALSLDHSPLDVLSPVWYEVPASGDRACAKGDPDPALVHLAAFRGASLWPLVRLLGRPPASSLGALARSLDQLARSQRSGGILIDPRPARERGQPFEGSDLLEVLGSNEVRLGLVLDPAIERSCVDRLWTRVRWIAVSPADPAVSWVPPDRLLLLQGPPR